MQILQKVREGTARVRDGMAAFERDSVVFDKPQYNWPLLACLMLVAAENRGRLRVLDVGGALGSSYYQNRSLLADLQELSWCIVEQPHFVDVGRREFQDRTLKFCASYEEALGYGPNIALLSSVLPYMEAPYDALAKVEALNCAYILVDRTGFTLNDQDRLTVQRVPPHIYTASYPCWFLSKSRFLDALSAAYQLVVEFEGADHANIPAEYKGYLFRRREAV
jgi:putative methyltransferase (TIGR04325 family)